MGFLSVSFYKTYYYFILVWIFDILDALIKGIFDYKYYDKIDFPILVELIYLICVNIGDLLAGFLVLYTHKTSQSVKPKEIEDNSRNKSHIQLIYNDLSIKKNKYYLLLIISILELLARSTDFFYFLILGSNKIRDGEITWLISIDILSRILFSHLILKRNLYKHHKLSIYLTIIGLCSMSVCAFIDIQNYELMNWPYFIFISIRFIIYSLEDVINKLLLINKFLLPQDLMLWRGIYILVIFLVLFPIFYFTKFIKYKFEIDITSLDLFLQISLLVLIIPFLFLKSFFILKVIYIFTPQHIAFINAVFYMLRLLRCRISTGDSIFLISIDSILLIIIIFSTLLFNEMVIINSCGLNENTKVGFLIKEEKEKEDVEFSQDELNKTKESIDDKNE